MGHFRTIINAVAGGVLMGKSIDDAYELLEEMAVNNYQWPSEHINPRRTTSINELEVTSSLVAQVILLTKNLESMTKKFDSMAIYTTQAIQSQAGAYEQCDDNHLSSCCPLNMELAHFMGNHTQHQCNNPYFNSYNPGERNYPNFTLSNQNQ
ncbi:hypothetical protein PanWU01x14_321200 [Parasponia andersonii]|uniref:Uncharacterized protein n=1 Tax=Parasponia andersonii TaxID=3476 RepID=A0A2P5ALJ5_PARAD|nr:hypothetical protein PanWU01x14_321200 [Parasponia andersonii]